MHAHRHKCISGIPPDSLRVRVSLGLRFSLHVVGALEQGRRNSPGTKGEGRGLFCNSCLNKLSVTVTVTVTVTVCMLTLTLTLIIATYKPSHASKHPACTQLSPASDSATWQKLILDQVKAMATTIYYILLHFELRWHVHTYITVTADSRSRSRIIYEGTRVTEKPCPSLSAVASTRMS